MPKQRDPNALYCDDKSLTQQSHAGDCDINEIIRRSANGAGLPASNRVPLYGDFTNIPTTHEAFEFVRRAGEAFMSLDWRIRERFANSPQKMVDFLNDPANTEEAIKLGLIDKPVATPAKPAEPPASPPAGGPATPPPGGSGGSAQ